MSPRADEDVLRHCLEQAAPDVFGGPGGIATLHRDRCKLVTSYDAYVLTARLAAGGEVRAFLKDFGVSARPKDGPRERRERELQVYRELLADAGLGTPRYYGSVWDAAAGRFWLLLEYVDGTPVGYCDLACWAPAAAVLGRLHGHFGRYAGRLGAHDFLIRHDTESYRAKADMAVCDVGQLAPYLVDRLAPVVRRYLELVPVLVDQPVTLLHGGCRATNILIRVAYDPDRACILDWEEAGIGAPLFDVAYLLDGIEPPTIDPLLEAYRRDARAYGLPLPAPADMKYVMDCFRLHLVMNSFSQAVLKRFKENGILKLLALGERICDGLARRGS
ncbi:MAG TPA: aminoglycoside phosphotransferase family protein [Gemmataceae bacterium]|nr:aminoglycoside phosphotransferase family protein [Gemmataceae bacterium]